MQPAITYVVKMALKISRKVLKPEILTGYSRRRIKWGTAPASTTTLVCKELPEAMLVKAQAASKSIVLVSCWSGEDTLKKATNFGTENIFKKNKSVIGYLNGSFFSEDIMVLGRYKLDQFWHVKKYFGNLISKQRCQMP